MSAHLAGSPWKARGHAEEAEVAREAHVGVGDEHDHVAVGVAACRHYPRRQRRRPVDQVRRRPCAELGEVVELVLERAHERLVRADGHVLVEHGARRGDEHAGVRERLVPPTWSIWPCVRTIRRIGRSSAFHRFRERLPLRAHHHRVDDRQAVVVDDHARVAHARLAAGLEPDVHAVRDVVERAVRGGLRRAERIATLRAMSERSLTCPAVPACRSPAPARR